MGKEMRVIECLECGELAGCHFNQVIILCQNCFLNRMEECIKKGYIEDFEKIYIVCCDCSKKTGNNWMEG